MMKLQDVLLKAMAKKITWWEAAEIIGVTDRSMRRWRERLGLEGYSGLVDRRKGKPSDRRGPVGEGGKGPRLFPGGPFWFEKREFFQETRGGQRNRQGLHWGGEGGARARAGPAG